ncbi:MAG TPA: hypothetical protein PLS49_04415 [Candidatus Woesebacteria bacterium]|nr:hypothetical protein [Candidatus Woesebacteria bacterium]
MNTIKSSKHISDREDLHNHGVNDIIPPHEEYYTGDLKRGNDVDVNDLPDFDIGANDPLNKDEEIVFFNPDKSTSSNAGGTIRQKDIVTTDNMGVPGEPGHVGIDEDTG